MSKSFLICCVFCYIYFLPYYLSVKLKHILLIYTIYTSVSLMVTSTCLQSTMGRILFCRCKNHSHCNNVMMIQRCPSRQSNIAGCMLGQLCLRRAGVISCREIGGSIPDPCVKLSLYKTLYPKFLMVCICVPHLSVALYKSCVHN